ncbi:diadenylate cyclase [Priestia filamentosa]|uniref:diadenylate cyclase n=1 Tax=Priestia filamentosa TaxID=1402861 RepID=UPI0005894938
MIHHVVYILDIAIISAIIYLIYKLIRKTEAFKIIIGLLVIFIFYYVAKESGLELTATILQRIFQISSLGLILIFQPELRTMLRKLGGFFTFTQEKKEIIHDIEEAAFSMSKDKVGALIIFDPEEKVTFQTEDMVKINADYSNELLETIFFKNSPLHDGAVIIQNGKIAYAGCKLPLKASVRKEYGHLGTRHLAALETAEMFDVTGIVVSEETGNISIATSRGIRKIETKEKFRLFLKERKKAKKRFEKIQKKQKKY